MTILKNKSYAQSNEKKRKARQIHKVLEFLFKGGDDRIAYQSIVICSQEQKQRVVEGPHRRSHKIWCMKGSGATCNATFFFLLEKVCQNSRYQI